VCRFLLLAWMPLAILALWAVVSANAWVPPLLLPTPWAVLTRGWVLITSGELLHHVWVSCLRVLGGFTLSATLAMVMAFWTHQSEKADLSWRVVLDAFRVIPPLALIPLLILWLGIAEGPKIAIVILATFFPVYISVRSGLAQAQKRFGELSQVLALTPSQHLKHILLPGAREELATGLQIGFGYAWRALVSAELIATSSGLGYLISDAGMFMHTDVVLVGILTIAVLGLGSEQIFSWLFHRLLSNRRRAH